MKIGNHDFHIFSLKNKNEKIINTITYIQRFKNF
jgi:hypothetical protein